MLAPTDYGHGIYLIDADYLRPGFAGIYLMVEAGRVAVIETGCNASLPRVLSFLDDLGIAVGSVDYVIPTHVHLDHAGGAGAMMRAFPNARLVVHPRGARHMADPSKLVAGAVAVYGAEQVRALYGEILPIDATRIIEAADGLTVDLAGRQLLCLDVPGHARHHIAIVDEKTGHIFTGDTFGVSYPELENAGRQFVFPTITPVQLDPPALHASMTRLLSYQPQAMYLTHYGKLRDIEKNADDLRRRFDASLEIAREACGEGAERHRQILDGMRQMLIAELRAAGCVLPEARLLELLADDLELNAQGLGIWLDNQASLAN